MADIIVAPSRVHWSRRICAILAIALTIAWMIDHRGCVHWVRPEGERSRTTAYIHQQGDGACRLSWMESGNCGEVTYIRSSACNDQNLFNTGVWQWRWLAVSLNGKSLDRSEVRAWRAAAADVFMSPSIMFGDVDEAQRYRMGYPLEIAGLIAQVVAVIVAPISLLMLPVALLVALDRSLSSRFDPIRKRRLLLRRGVCPVCRYSLRGLPENRCPECGEGWSEWELSESDAEQQRRA